MFEEALQIARSNPEGDRWAEARALTFLASMRSGAADEAEVLSLGREALVVGREFGDPFTVAVALERVGTSLRRMLRLDEAFDAIHEAVRTFEDLGARWEHASVLGERGITRALQGQLEDAERDCRTALAIVRDLGDRTLINWIVRDLFEVLLDRGDREAARKLVAETEAELPATTEPGSRLVPLQLESLQALTEGDRDRALDRWLQVIEIEQSQPFPNQIAANVWFVGRVFGPEHVGGPEAVEAARQDLQAAHWRQALEYPDRVLARLQD
jgi:tetratricopeptide (TPR) repeat protein